MVFEHYIDASFLVDFFLPDEIATTNEKTWKNNARGLYDNIRNDSDAKLMISYESMLEAVGVLGRKLLEDASKKKQKTDRNYLFIRMAHIASEITRWEQEGKRIKKIRLKSPMSIDKRVYEKALEFCRKYSVTPSNSYYKGIGGIDAFHLAYAIKRNQPGKIQSFLITRDKALLKAAGKEGQPAREP